MGSTSNQAEAGTIYKTSFESNEGYSNKLVGANGWTKVGSGGNGLSPNRFPGLGQQAYIGLDPPAINSSSLIIYQPINFVPNTNTLSTVKFSVRMATVDSTNNARDRFWWGVYSQTWSNGFKVIFDNTKSNVPIYYWLDESPNLIWSTGVDLNNGLIKEFSIEMDFWRNTWSARIQGTTVVESKPITSKGSPLNLLAIAAGWSLGTPGSPGNNYMLFDDYRIEVARTQLPTMMPIQSPSLVGTISKEPNGLRYNLSFFGDTAQSYSIQASTNLFDWSTIGPAIGNSGQFWFSDPIGVNLNRRFYRAMTVP